MDETTTENPISEEYFNFEMLNTNISFMLNNLNESGKNFTDLKKNEYIFDRTDVRIIFITLYTLVFCCCFFGNLLVILVVTLSRRLRSITNFFLANLAVADLCVGVFCVFQSLSMYLIPSWVLGDFLCKMSQFVHSLSYTASIFILVVICTERYFAIIHPITCKQILTPTRLRLVIGAVWLTSALYSAPRFIWVQTIDNKIANGETETICTTHRQKYNSKVFDMINFVLLYVVPLAVMTILYTRIAVGLWRSSRVLEKHLNASMSTPTPPSPCEHTHYTCVYQAQPQEIKLQPLQRAESVRSNKHYVNFKFAMECGKQSASSGARAVPSATIQTLQNPVGSSQNILRARRGVIRMLIVVVLTFALCNLPFHARKMWQYWSSGYQGSSDFSTLFTPLTFLITYFNSGINPLLYAFLSRNFRRGMREILLCSLRSPTTRRNPGNKLYNITAARDIENGDRALGLFNRHASTRSTIKANTTTVTIINNVNSDIDECSQEV